MIIKNFVIIAADSYYSTLMIGEARLCTVDPPKQAILEIEP